MTASPAEAPGVGASERVLVLTPTGADARVCAQLLAEQGMAARICSDLTDLCDRFTEGAAAMVIADEALVGADSARLSEALATQPPWSDLPLIVLTTAGDERSSERIVHLLETVGNITLLERPFRASTLISMVRVALRARRRQYDVRRLMASEREALVAARDAREQQLAAERSARAEAERVGRMKDEFLATLSHELRTPLQAMLGWAQVLRRIPDDNPDRSRGLDVIDRNARAQKQLIEDLLDMSGIASGKTRLERSRVTLAPIIEAAIESVQPAALARDVHIEHRAPDEPVALQADPGRLQQVVWNLLSNAIKFTPAGGRIDVRAERDADANAVRILVTDSGRGIDADFLPHVFERFRQSDGSSRRRHGGLGLGLAIVKQLVELHGGGVAAQSDGEDRGATFTVWLPLDGADESPASEAAPADAGHERAALAGKPIVVVDDDDDARELITRVLQSHGATVHAAASAPDALALVRRHQPALLVSDLGMPGMDGYDLIRHLRACEAADGGATPALALTAFARPEDRARALGAGYQAHLVKPADPALLIRTCERLVGTPPTRQAATSPQEQPPVSGEGRPQDPREALAR